MLMQGEDMPDEPKRNLIRTSDGKERCWDCGKEGGHPKLVCEKCGETHLTAMHDLPRRGTGIAIFEPSECGWLCPQRHRASNICWSEFKDYIWCCVCEKDYSTAECFLQKPPHYTETEFQQFVKSLPFVGRVLPGVLEIGDGEWR